MYHLFGNKRSESNMVENVRPSLTSIDEKETIDLSVLCVPFICSPLKVQGLSLVKEKGLPLL